MTNWKKHLAILVFYGLVGFLAFYHPLFHNSTHIPGVPPTDFYHFHWSWNWLREAAFDPSLDLYYTDYVMFPYQNNLAYHTLAAFWVPLWAFLEPLTGTLAAMNWIFALCITLTGYFSFFFFKREGVPRSLALVGGVIMAVSPLMLRAIWWTNPNLTGIFWYPALLLAWGSLAQSIEQRYRVALSGIGIGLMLVAMILTDLQFALFAPWLVVPYALVTLYRVAGASRLKLVGVGVIAVLTAVICLWVLGTLPAVLDYDQDMTVTIDLENTWGIHFPSGYLWNAPDYHALPRLGGMGLLALIAGLLVTPFVQTANIRWLWLLVAVPLLILSMGASITLNGQQIGMPYQLYHQAAGSIFRFPERFATLFLVAALLFGGLSLAPLVSQRGRGTRYLLAGGLLLLTFANLRTFHPMQISPAPPHFETYAQMGDDEANYVVVEVPTSAGSGVQWVGDPAATALQFYGTVHQKKMINGHLTRANVNHWWYLMTDDPLLSWLGQRRYLDPEAVRAELETRIVNDPIGYFVIHQNIIGRDEGANEEITGYFNSLHDLLCPPIVERETVFYRTVSHPDGCMTDRLPTKVSGRNISYKIDIGSGGDERFLGLGWHYPEQIAGISIRWAGGESPEHSANPIKTAITQNRASELYVSLPPADYRLTLSAQAYHAPRDLTILFNGQVIGTETVPTESLSVLRYTIPETAFSDANSQRLTLAYDDLIAPVELNAGDQTRTLAMMVDWLAFQRE